MATKRQPVHHSSTGMSITTLQLDTHGRPSALLFGLMAGGADGPGGLPKVLQPSLRPGQCIVGCGERL